MESNILLESGTNELELLEFFVGDKDYGINIAKVRSTPDITEINILLIFLYSLNFVFNIENSLF